jgi:enoyl-CoA hydratase/carnithine racemase
VCITGAGDRAFCSGADLAADMSSRGAAGAVRLFAELMKTMDATGTPLVASVNGYCMAGGMGLMLGCDIAVATEDAKFGTPEVRSGLFPMVIAPVIVRHVGPKRAMEMLFAARRYTAPQAEAMGLINRAVPAAQLDAEVQKVIDDILSGGPMAIAAGRRAMARTRNRNLSLPEASDELAEEFLKLLTTEDALEGISAFLQKRTPEWKGR